MSPSPVMTDAPWFVAPIEDPATTSRPCGCGFHPGTPMECFAAMYPDETPEYLATMVRSDERWWMSQVARDAAREAEPASPVPEPRVRRAPRPAAYWRDLLDKAQAELDRITGSVSSDPAVVNLSHTSRSRAARSAGARRMAKLGRDVERVAYLTRRTGFLRSKVASAEAREAKAGAR